MALPVFSLQPGLLNLGLGIYKAESVIHCNQDGSITLTWTDQTKGQEVVTMKEGQDFAIYEADLVEITAGDFHMSRQQVEP